MRPAGYELLLANFQALNQRAVARIVLALQVIEQLAAAAYQTQQAAPGMVILDVILEMPGQISDTGSDQSHLYFGGTGIALGALKVGHDLRFLRGGNCHWFHSPKKSAAFYPLLGLLLKPNKLRRSNRFKRRGSQPDHLAHYTICTVLAATPLRRGLFLLYTHVNPKTGYGEGSG